MLKSPVQHQSPLHVAAGLFGRHSMLGRQNLHLVAARPQVFHDGLAPEIVRARMVRRIQIGQRKNLHKPGDERVGELSGLSMGDALRPFAHSHLRQQSKPA